MLTPSDIAQIQKLLEPILRKLNKMEKKIDTTITYFDGITTTHHQRLHALEKLQGFVVNDEDD